MNIFFNDLKRAVKFFKKTTHWVIFGRVYVLLMALILTVVLSRTLSLDEYGTYQFFLSTFVIFTSFSLTASTNIVLKYAALGYESVVPLILKLRLKFSLIGSILLIAWALYSIDNKQLLFILLLSLVLPFYSCFDLFEYLLQARVNFKKLNIIYIIRSSIIVAIPLGMLLLTKNPFIILIAYLICFSATNVVFNFKLSQNLNGIKTISNNL